jgi:hypothetical protein
VETEGTRTDRLNSQGLASSLCLLVLAGVSCKVPVSLPSADSGPGDSGKGGVADASMSIDMPSQGEKTGGRYGQDQCNTTYRAVANTVEMIIALDRSTSMQKSSFDGMTRLQAAQMAIGTATKAHDGIGFGLELFPWPSCSGGATCCGGAPTKLTNLESQMTCNADGGCQSVGSDSPSHSALWKCYENLNATFSKKPPVRFVLLITDKDPFCSGDASTGAPLCAQATDAAWKLAQLGVQTFVLSLGSDVSSTPCLQAIAETNAYELYVDSGTQFFAVSNQQQLSQQIDSIMTKAEKNLCWFYLDGKPSGTTPPSDQLEIVVNGNNVPRDGYSFNANSRSLEILGNSCDELLNASGGAIPTVSICQSTP